MTRRLLLATLFSPLAFSAPTPTAWGQTLPQAASGNYRVINLMPLFWQFWEKARGYTRLDKVRLFRKMIEEPHKSLYLVVNLALQQDDYLADYLDKLVLTVPAIRTISDRLPVELPACHTSFLKAFPDMSWAGDVYFLPTGFTFDGATRQLEGKSVLLFGVDMIATLQGPKGNLAPLIHHELFHLHHRTVAPEAFDRKLLGKLWTEGLAVYVSGNLNPNAPLDELLIPAALAQRCDAELPRLVREVKDKLDSQTFQDFTDFFDGGSKRPDVPPRAGYYIGLLLARDIATRLPIREMTRLRDADLRREVMTALDHLTDAPPQARRAGG